VRGRCFRRRLACPGAKRFRVLACPGRDSIGTSCLPGSRVGAWKPCLPGRKVVRASLLAREESRVGKFFGHGAILVWKSCLPGSNMVRALLLAREEAESLVRLPSRIGSWGHSVDATYKKNFLRRLGSLCYQRRALVSVVMLFCFDTFFLLSWIIYYSTFLSSCLALLMCWPTLNGYLVGLV
jgi:hypothetical protein